MITEDYVSFETSKLLKEKGFDEPCQFLYFSKYKQEGDFIGIIGNFHARKNSEINEASYSAPTLQLAMKWLRKVYNLFIVIDKHYFVVDRISHIASGFKYSIEIKTINTVYVHNDYKSYEEACESAIKYCLENLI